MATVIWHFAIDGDIMLISSVPAVRTTFTSQLLHATRPSFSENITQGFILIVGILTQCEHTCQVSLDHGRHSVGESPCFVWLDVSSKHVLSTRAPRINHQRLRLKHEATSFTNYRGAIPGLFSRLRELSTVLACIDLCSRCRRAAATDRSYHK